MKDEVLSILNDTYGRSILNAIAADSILQLIKEESSCNLDQEDENDFKVGDRVELFKVIKTGHVDKNENGKIGFVFNGKWISIMTKNIKKI